ncbi:MAG: molybdate ABC transporter substrate-binding protein [Nitriliruptorales bacterium]|nr:molybdate ABC transporter substrate-binding protein [Nitriliruptorales bacterium]
MVSRRSALALAGLLLTLTGCGAGAAGGGSQQATGPPSAVSGEVTVFAAASLTGAFEDLGEAFVERNPEAEMTFNFAGSQQLAGQIVHGAPADVFASANPTQMDVVADADLLASEPEVFATNLLEIAVEPGNPLGIQGLEDLAAPEVTLVLAAPDVPAGQYAAEALDGAGVEVDPASLEIDVRAALSKVALGEADAGIVYVSDMTAHDGVEGVAIPGEQNIRASYPIATVASSPNPGAASAFVRFTRFGPGQRILADHGFGAPGAR